MKTMEKLCKRFERLHPGYKAYFDSLESDRGFYRVTICGFGFGHQYTFTTCREFSEWIDGVVMD